jgi:hypothetical protein
VAAKGQRSVTIEWEVERETITDCSCSLLAAPLKTIKNSKNGGDLG